jgi:uncharacterized integral membrane protein
MSGTRLAGSASSPPKVGGDLRGPREEEAGRTEPIEASLPGESPPGTLAAPSTAFSGEPRGARLARRARGARLYASAGAFVALLAVLVILASANTDAAKLDWVVGSTRASLSWIILAAAIFGWLLGIATAVVVHRRTRRTRP